MVVYEVRHFVGCGTDVGLLYGGNRPYFPEPECLPAAAAAHNRKV